MIDEEWLKQLKFEMPDGTKISEFLGTGGETIVFGAEMPDGRDVALRVARQNLAWHLKEIPNFLTKEPLYNVNRLNAKLLNLVGEPYFEQMTGVYDKVHGAILSLLKQHGFKGLLKLTANSSMAEAMPLFLFSKGFNLRLQEIASQNDPGYKGPIDHRTAKQLLKDIKDTKLNMYDLQPGILATNPLYIWGGAVMDGLFTEKEFPQVAQYIEAHFGQLTKHKDFTSFITQIGAVADFLAQVLQNPEVHRLVRLCSATGYVLIVYDHTGKIVPGAR